MVNVPKPKPKAREEGSDMKVTKVMGAPKKAGGKGDNDDDDPIAKSLAERMKAGGMTSVVKSKD